MVLNLKKNVHKDKAMRRIRFIKKQLYARNVLYRILSYRPEGFNNTS